MSLSTIEKKPRVLGVTTSVLFDMSEPDALWRAEQNGDKAPGTYAAYMRDNIDYSLKPGPVFDFIAAWSQRPDHKIVLMSRNSMITGVRAMSSLLEVGVMPDQFVFTNGRSALPYIPYYQPNKFLTTDKNDAQAIQARYRVASASFDHKNTDAVVDFVKDEKVTPLYKGPQLVRHKPIQPTFEKSADIPDKISIIYDADGVVFDRSSEDVYQQHGLEAFRDHERQNINIPMQRGPHWNEFYDETRNIANYLTHILTSRGAEAFIRLGKTLANNDIEPSGEAHGVDGANKMPLVKIMQSRYGATTIIFDDSLSKIADAPSHGVTAGLVPTVRPKDPAA